MVVSPVLQRYDDAEEAVSKADSPIQVVVPPLMDATGSVFTVTVAVSLSVQPLPSVTVTVYVVVTEGDTVIPGALPRPPDHAYVPAPEAVSVVPELLQIVVVPLIIAVGSAFTVTVAVSLSVQPLPSVTVTV